jgi:quercetin dioxygenase-like cupin family protein
VEYVHRIDLDALRASPERTLLRLLDASTGSDHCAISLVKTPSGGGSPAGLHVHAVDQIFFVMEGVMTVEIDEERHDCGPGSLVIFPAGKPHRNWNAGEAATVHLTIAAPLPDPAVPFANPVER